MAAMDLFLGLLQSAGLDRVTSVWVYLTLVAAVLTGLYFWHPLCLLVREIKAFLNHTADLAPRSPGNVDVLDRYFADKRGSLAECWAAYRQARNDPLLQWPESRYPDVISFFPASSLIERAGRRRLAEAIPGMLTAFGILGTFVGLSVGLRGLTVADVDQIRTSIDKLLGGMNVAFYSSVVAIFCSITWLAFDRQLLGKAVAGVDQLHDRLLLLLPAPAEPELLQQLLLAQQEHTSTIKTFVSDFLLPKLVEGFTNAVQETLIPEVERTTKVLTGALPEIVAGFREAVENSIAPHIRQTAAAVEEFARAGTARQVEGIQQMATEFLRALDGQVRDHFDNLALLVRELIDASARLTADASAFAQRMEDFAILNERVGSKVGDMLSVLGAYTEEFRHFHALLESAMQSIREATRQAQEFHVQLGKHLSTMSDVQSTLNDTWLRLSADLHPRIVELAKVWEDTHERLATLNGSLEHSAEAFASSLHAGLSRTFESFDENLARATRHLAGSLGQMNETVEEISDQLGHFRRLVTDVSAGLTNLQQLVTAISGAVSQFQGLFAQVLHAVGPREEDTR